ncbi:transaldolase [Aestuariimicrobium ganziense]|uniref:transaldolase n=1 Tax=Aestuariimicrobium ganziense TaxID=2773677 RepID=UPI001940BF17|nr:transaldolase [Aestuariimicrobium ganziense]
MTDTPTPNPRTAALSAAGVSIWLDDLSRERLDSGNLAELIQTLNVVGVTTNPTIFAAALADGEAYTEQLAGLAGQDPVTVAHQLTSTDVRDACELFAPVYEATDGFDGRVSIEVDPGLAMKTDETVTEAASLAELVDRPNVLVKIPATLPGLEAIRRTIAAGISVNVTLIFSVERYRAVADAYLSGLEDALAAGRDLSTIHSVASVFVSRIDTEVDKRLDAIGTEQALALKGQAAIANTRLARQAAHEVFTSERFRALAAQGAHPQRALWASTGVKDPAYPDTRYVTELVSSGVVNTMPEKTLLAFADHGEVRGDTIEANVDDAVGVTGQLREVGIDLDDVFASLEDEAVAKFEASWAELLQTVTRELEKLS